MLVNFENDNVAKTIDDMSDAMLSFLDEIDGYMHEFECFFQSLCENKHSGDIKSKNSGSMLDFGVESNLGRNFFGFDLAHGKFKKVK